MESPPTKVYQIIQIRSEDSRSSRLIRRLLSCGLRRSSVPSAWRIRAAWRRWAASYRLSRSRAKLGRLDALKWIGAWNLTLRSQYAPNDDTVAADECGGSAHLRSQPNVAEARSAEQRTECRRRGVDLIVMRAGREGAQFLDEGLIPRTLQELDEAMLTLRGK